MKTRNHIVWVLFLVFFAGYRSTLYAQNTKKEKEASTATAIKNMVANQRYVFKAQTALPMSGQLRQLTSEYSVSISKDTVQCYLPYFGRAYVAPIGTSGGIDFISTNFEYVPIARKRGGWDIRIKPKGVDNVQQLFFTITESGFASLQVTSTNRQPISFNGYIEAATKRK